MRVRLLGTAAGGGFPQWNCNCANCRGLRSGSLRAKTRTQSCVAISADDEHWFLLNASPDIRQQIEHAPALAPKEDEWRDTRINGILLSDADLDHTLGLFTLREGQPLTVYASPQVRQALTVGLPASTVLEAYSGIYWQELAHTPTPLLHADGTVSQLTYQAYPVAGKPPRYMEQRAEPQIGDRVGYRFVDQQTGGRLLFLPGLASFDTETRKYLGECDAVLFDGTFWSENEMEISHVGSTTASQMGHLPVGGPEGSLNYLQSLAIKRIYIHINNTNPMLVEDSLEASIVHEAGIEIGWDGLEFTL
ncbi:pyrroloquinoline quinone biosynthesis protein PqqB [Tengunoibacter tsumagoiensis]|uniref:Coenzyme PQQ synthesis protein B n=1 Tax=Tengunoibacter tsumagoiensis TaxID=2014871 RepID=A0A402A282_9CHLR|nr:pyrroloquinoline quinone biosynthesis protein PqqB [Tengunoibacter tsumagoiensis]GCE13253.1 coenzyme PQQ synthesis protein B [Tengunoibacter tsumagoiensis]